MRKLSFLLLTILLLSNFSLSFYIELQDSGKNLNTNTFEGYKEILEYISDHQHDLYYKEYQDLIEQFNALNKNVYNPIDIDWIIIAKHVVDLSDASVTSNRVFMGADAIYHHPNLDFSLIHYAIKQHSTYNGFQLELIRPFKRFYGTEIRGKELFNYTRSLHNNLGNLVINNGSALNNLLEKGFVGICKSDAQFSMTMPARYIKNNKILIKTYGGDSGKGIFISSEENTNNIWRKYCLLGLQMPAGNSLNINTLPNDWINSIILKRALNSNLIPSKSFFIQSPLTPIIELNNTKSLPLFSRNTLIDPQWIIGTKENLKLGINSNGQPTIRRINLTKKEEIKLLNEVNVDKTYPLNNGLILGHLSNPCSNPKPLMRYRIKPEVNENFIAVSTTLKAFIEEAESNVPIIRRYPYGVAQFKEINDENIHFTFPEISNYPYLVASNIDKGNGNPLLKLYIDKFDNEIYQIIGIISEINGRNIECYNLTKKADSAEIDKIILTHTLNN